MLTLRPTAETDREFIYAVMKASDIRFIDKLWGWNEERQRGIFDREFDKGAGSVIEYDGERAGFALVFYGEDEVEIAELHLDAAFQNKGVGTEFITSVVRDNPGKKIIIGTFKQNLGAKRLYERLGFRFTHFTENHIWFSMTGGTLPEFELPAAGMGFIERGDKRKITRSGIKNLSSGDVAAVYFRARQTGAFTVAIKCEGAADAEIKFTVNGDCKTVKLADGGEITGEVEFSVTKTGYIRITLETDGRIPLITSVVIRGVIADGFVKIEDKENYYWTRRGPSVHLGYRTAGDAEIAKPAWFYNELTVPEGFDPVGTYAMAAGFSVGYFGIQVNSRSERRILFSVWSPHVTDDPASIPENRRVRLLAKNDRVSAQDFGGEGSGGQSFMRYDWRAGQTCRFLLHAESGGDNQAIFTAYFDFPDSGWELIASFRRPETEGVIARPHSFLENFADVNGYITRRAEFSNAWLFDENGAGVPLTRVEYTGDATVRAGNRFDCGGGIICGGGFYLQNGGFFDDDTKLRTVFDAGKEASPRMPEIDFARLTEMAK